jgi:hypothetical protein
MTSVSCGGCLSFCHKQPTINCIIFLFSFESVPEETHELFELIFIVFQLVISDGFHSTKA